MTKIEFNKPPLMKRMKLTLLFLAIVMLACAQEQKIPGLLKVDTVQYKEMGTFTSDPESGFLLNVNGYPLWHNGVSVDTLNLGESYTFSGGVTNNSGTVTLDDTIYVNYVTEATGNEGVTIEYVLVEDSSIFFSGNKGIYWNNSGIHENIPDNIHFRIGGTDRLVLTSATLAPITTSAIDLGSALKFYQQAYIDTIYLDNINTKIYYYNGNLYFKDLVTDAKSLADLVAGSGNLLAANNLSDVANAVTSLGNLGLTATASEINTPLDGALVTLTEFKELETIGATTIASEQWSMLGSTPTSVTGVEVGYVNGATSNIQGQIDISHAMFQDSLGWFNVLSYGAKNDSSEITSIQNAINAAYADGGGVVYVPSGIYRRATAPDTLKDGVSIVRSADATFYIDAGYNGWLWTTDGKYMQFSGITGGKDMSTEGAGDWGWLKVNQTEGAFIRNWFEDIVVYFPDTLISLEASGTGWINANHWNSFWTTGNDYTIHANNNGLGINGNWFTEIEVQSRPDSRSFGIFKGSGGSSRNFITASYWDGNNDSTIVKFDPNSWRNHVEFIGSANGIISDSGMYNSVLNQGRGYFWMDSLRFWSEYVDTTEANINRIILSGRYRSGTSANPHKDQAIKFKSSWNATNIQGASQSSKIVHGNSSTDDYAGHLWFQVHGPAYNESEEAYIDALYIDGSKGGDATFIDDVTINHDLTVTGTITNTGMSEVITDEFMFYNKSTGAVTYGDTAGFGGGGSADSLDWYNVLDFGTDNTGVSNAQPGIQAAVDAAEADGHGVVYIPSGTYLFNTAAVTIKSKVHIQIDRYAQFNGGSGYSGDIFYSGDEGNLIDASIDGGRLYDGTFKITFVRIAKNSSTYALRVAFSNMICESANIMYDFETSNGGWANGITVDKAWSWRNKSWLKTREGSGSNGIDGNLYSNCHIQSWDSTWFGIDSLSGSWNSFENIMMWDFGGAGRRAEIQTIVLGSASSYNNIQGGNLGSISLVTDLGRNNKIQKSGITSIGPIADSALIHEDNYSAGEAYHNRLTLSRDGATGSTGSPSGDNALKIYSAGSSLKEATTSNGSIRLVAKGEGSSNYSSHAYLQVHGTASNHAESAYIDALYIDGSKGGDATFIDDVTINHDLTVTGTITNTGMSEVITDEFMFYNKSTGAVTYGDTAGFGGGGGSSPWSVAANIITPTTGGDDIRLSSTEQLQFIDDDNFIRSSSVNIVDTYIDSFLLIRYEVGELNITGNILPAGGGRTIGNGSSFFSEAFLNRSYLDNTGTYFDTSGDDITFTRSVAGTKTVGSALGYNAQTGTSYILVLTDDSKFVKCTNASAITVTVPPNSSVAFPYSSSNLTEVTIQQGGAGMVTIAAGSGVTIHSYNSDLTLAGQYAVVTLVKTGINTWELMGNL